MKRQFWLSNEDGKCYYLNNERGVILYNVKGLGIETGVDFYDLGNGFFKPVDSNKRPQKPITGTLLFHSELPEDEYRNLANFVEDSDALYFHFAPSTKQYMRRVALNFFTKGQLPLPEVLKVPVSFLPLTPWYTNDVEIYSLGVVSDGFRAMDEEDIDASMDEPPLDVDEFPLELDGGEGLEAEVEDVALETLNGESRIWDETTDEDECLWQRLSETDVMEGGIVIQPKGQIDSTFNLSFEGTAVAPTFYIVGTSTGKEYGRLVLSASFSDGERLEYSTSNLNSYARKISRKGAVDLVDSIDASYEAFPRLPTTEPCRIVMTSEGQIDGTMTVAVQRYMVGV